MPAQADEAFGTYDYPRPERASALAARHAQTRFLLVPRAAYGIERTWDTVGMRGTGSDTLALDEVFVPIEHGRVRRRACRPP
ncbi:hypothetical protein [Streptomyces sp. NPDC001980]|uniref:hypothetical protein n=1 Tax=Streptomyces sp. NPDC001980 TaxID=3157126 RepID=UPI00332E270B